MRIWMWKQENIRMMEKAVSEAAANGAKMVRQFNVFGFNVDWSRDSNPVFFLFILSHPIASHQIVLPEMWNCPYSNESFPIYAEDIDAGDSPSAAAMSSKLCSFVLILFLLRLEMQSKSDLVNL